MSEPKRRVSRRTFLKGSAAVAGLTVLPRHVLGGPDQAPPSETIACGLVGCGGQGGEDIRSYIGGNRYKVLVCCDVDSRRLDRKRQRLGEGIDGTTDFRRVVERQDLDVVSVATPPHWHALIAIAAMEAGKDVLCEKPMTRFIAEGRAVVDAAKRYGRVFQLGTGRRFGASRSNRSRQVHKIMRSGLLEDCKAVYIKRGGFKARQWSGMVNLTPRPVPNHLDWDMYCGPSPLRPYHPLRFGGSHRRWWDYDGGGLADMGQHYLDPFQWIYGKDDTSPVEIRAHAPPAHPEAAGMWGWVEMRYADGLTLVLDSGEWGKPYDRKKPRGVSLADLSEEDRKKLAEMPDPQPMHDFVHAIRHRTRSGGNAESSHRSATLLHLANIAIRMGRPIRYDPDKEQVVGDEEANRLVDQPMRAPWHL
ncbi:MAG: Gfo/Idh/MocA family oxidoreductase [Candidatus Brocadiia bacterium]